MTRGSSQDEGLRPKKNVPAAEQGGSSVILNCFFRYSTGICITSIGSGINTSQNVSTCTQISSWFETKSKLSVPAELTLYQVLKWINQAGITVSEISPTSTLFKIYGLCVKVGSIPLNQQLQ